MLHRRDLNRRRHARSRTGRRIVSITGLGHITGAGHGGDETAWRIVTINRPPVSDGRDVPVWTSMR